MTCNCDFCKWCNEEKENYYCKSCLMGFLSKRFYLLVYPIESLRIYHYVKESMSCMKSSSWACVNVYESMKVFRSPPKTSKILLFKSTSKWSKWHTSTYLFRGTTLHILRSTYLWRSTLYIGVKVLHISIVQN